MFAGPDFGPTGKIAYGAVTFALMLLSYRVINVGEHEESSGRSGAP